MYSDTELVEGLKEKDTRMLGRLRPITSDLRILLTMLHQAIWQKETVIKGHLNTQYNITTVLHLLTRLSQNTGLRMILSPKP